jgi:hypothetical protein
MAGVSGAVFIVFAIQLDTEDAIPNKAGKNNEGSVVCIRNTVQKIVALIVIAQPKQPMLNRLETETPLIWESFHHVSQRYAFPEKTSWQTAPKLPPAQSFHMMMCR